MKALILPHGNRRPRFGNEVFLAPTVTVIGDVTIGDRASIWYGSVLRGDVHRITIGVDTNVQDNCVLHGTLDEFPVTIGARVSIGHSATVHGANVGDDCLIGIGARVLDGVRIGSGSIVAAGALIRQGTIVPPGSLIAGVPGVIKRDLAPRELEVLRRTPTRYRKLAVDARASLLAAGLPDPFVPPTPL